MNQNGSSMKQTRVTKKSKTSKSRNQVSSTQNSLSSNSNSQYSHNMQAHKKDSKCRKLDHSASCSNKPLAVDHLSRLSLETLCHIMYYLPFYDVIKVESLSHKLHEAVTLHLRLLTEVDFTEGEIYGWMPVLFNDLTFIKLLSRCQNLIQIFGLHPCTLSKRRHSRAETLSVPGVVEALNKCVHLEYVETSEIFLLEAIVQRLPQVSVGDFRNRNGHFPIPASNKLSLTRSCTMTTLQLHGVTLTDIPCMENLKHLHLRYVVRYNAIFL